MYIYDFQICSMQRWWYMAPKKVGEKLGFFRPQGWVWEEPLWTGSSMWAVEGAPPPLTPTTSPPSTPSPSPGHRRGTCLPQGSGTLSLKLTSPISLQTAPLVQNIFDIVSIWCPQFLAEVLLQPQLLHDTATCLLIFEKSLEKLGGKRFLPLFIHKFAGKNGKA